jgi:hypothetical protein
MKPPAKNPVVRTSCAVASALLALTLVACERQPESVAKAAPPPATLEPPPLVVTPPKPAEPPHAVADKELAGKVKSALLAERGLNAHGIDVVAKNGVITLYGTAETPMRRDVAGRVAGTVAGVKSVENKLAVVAGS